MEISVIIPTYKPKNYIFDCLKSLSSQDFPIDEFEVIVVLNGEKEPYFQDLTNFLANMKIHSRLLYSHLASVSIARNLALNSLNSKYVTFVDDDDIVSESYLMSLHNAIMVRDSISVCNFKTFTNDTSSTGSDYVTKCYEKCAERATFSLFAYRGFMSSVCGKLIPCEMINLVRFNSRLELSEDALFMFRISSFISQITLADENAIYYRRLRVGSASRTHISWCKRFIYIVKLNSNYLFYYFKSPFKFNLLFFLSRVMASLKYFILN